MEINMRRLTLQIAGSKPVSEETANFFSQCHCKIKNHESRNENEKKNRKLTELFTV